MCHRPSEPSADRARTVSVARRPTAWSCCGTIKSSSAVRNQSFAGPATDAALPTRRRCPGTVGTGVPARRPEPSAHGGRCSSAAGTFNQNTQRRLLARRRPVLVAFAATTAQYRVSLFSSFPLSVRVCLAHRSAPPTPRSTRSRPAGPSGFSSLHVFIILERATHHAPHHTGEPANRHQRLVPRVTPSSLITKKPERSSQAAARDHQLQEPTGTPAEGGPP